MFFFIFYILISDVISVLWILMFYVKLLTYYLKFLAKFLLIYYIYIFFDSSYSSDFLKITTSHHFDSWSQFCDSSSRCSVVSEFHYSDLIYNKSTFLLLLFFFYILWLTVKLICWMIFHASLWFVQSKNRSCANNCARFFWLVTANIFFLYVRFPFSL